MGEQPRRGRYRKKSRGCCQWAISLPDLADQYLAAIADLDRVGLARATDWLVMAAWLTWLKSRLLLPRSAEEAQQAEQAAAALADRLAVAERVRAAAARLERRAQLGRDVWERGVQVETAPDRGADAASGGTDRARDLASHPEAARLLWACLAALGGKPDPTVRYRPSSLPVWTVPKARGRVRRLLSVLPEESAFERFVPEVAAAAPDRALRCRSAVAGTFVTLLESARAGALRLVQPDPPFGPIRVHAVVTPATHPADPSTPA